MAYGNLLADVVQSSITGTPPQFNDGAGTQTGTLCRAWARFTGSTAVISASFNVSSITRSSAGNYLVNFTTALPDTNYAVAGAGDNASTYYLLTSKISANTTSSAGLQLINAATTAGDGTVSVAVFR
jgi:hypothetical protein